MPIRERPAQPDDTAETAALQALGFVAADPDMLARFMGLAGVSIDELKTRAAEPSFLGGVLDFVLADEKLLLEFCEASGLKPASVARLRGDLPGAPVWE
jgi:hypothetical protein